MSDPIFETDRNLDRLREAVSRFGQEDVQAALEADRHKASSMEHCDACELLDSRLQKVTQEHVARQTFFYSPSRAHVLGKEVSALSDAVARMQMFYHPQEAYISKLEYVMKGLEVPYHLMAKDHPHSLSLTIGRLLNILPNLDDDNQRRQNSFAAT